MNQTYSSPYRRPDWIVSQCIWIVYFSVTAYLLFGLLLYIWRHRAEQQVRRRRGLLMYGTVTVSFAFALTEMGINEWGLLYMASDPITCKSWRQVHHLAFVSSLCPGYIFLWIRQHAFYGDSMLKTLRSKKLTVFSWFVLAMFFVGYLFFLVFFLHPSWSETHSYNIESAACWSGKHKNSSTFFYLIAVGFLLFYQLSLLFLFTYPIIRSSKDDPGELSATMQVVMGYIGKCRNVTILSASTDILAFASSLIFKKLFHLPLSCQTIVYDLDLLVNLSCLLICLKPWKDIIMPWRHGRRETRPSTGSAGGGAKYGRGESYVMSETEKSVHYRPIKSFNSQTSSHSARIMS